MLGSDLLSGFLQILHNVATSSMPITRIPSNSCFYENVATLARLEVIASGL